MSSIRAHEVIRTTVSIEHNMDVVFTYWDHIAVIRKGAIRADGTPADIRASAAMATILLGTLTAE
jgi:ABC-type branched-subunit amino acid transport system ATPase component